MRTYNDELLLKIEKTLLLMGYSRVHPKKIAGHWQEYPIGEAEPWEMRVRATLDTLGLANKPSKNMRKNKTPVLIYKEGPGCPVQILVER